MFAPWRIPTLVSRPWRLIPELDAFSDRRCAEFAGPLRRERLVGLLVAGVITLPMALPLAILCFMLIEHVIEPAWPAVKDQDAIAFRLIWLLTALTVIGTTLWLALTPYVLLVRRGLLQKLCRAACPSCGYSLLGLRVTDGSAACPECGRDIVLADHGLREQDLLSGAALGDRTADRPSPVLRFVTRAFHAAAAVVLALWLVLGWPLLLIGVALGYPVLLLVIAHLHGLAMQR